MLSQSPGHLFFLRFSLFCSYCFFIFSSFFVLSLLLLHSLSKGNVFYIENALCVSSYWYYFLIYWYIFLAQVMLFSFIFISLCFLFFRMRKLRRNFWRMKMMGKVGRSGGEIVFKVSFLYFKATIVTLWMAILIFWAVLLSISDTFLLLLYFGWNRCFILDEVNTTW